MPLGCPSSTIRPSTTTSVKAMPSPGRISITISIVVSPCCGGKRNRYSRAADVIAVHRISHARRREPRMGMKSVSSP